MHQQKDKGNSNGASVSIITFQKQEVGESIITSSKTLERKRMNINYDSFFCIHSWPANPLCIIDQHKQWKHFHPTSLMDLVPLSHFYGPTNGTSAWCQFDITTCNFTRGSLLEEIITWHVEKKPVTQIFGLTNFIGFGFNSVSLYIFSNFI